MTPAVAMLLDQVAALPPADRDLVERHLLAARARRRRSELIDARNRAVAAIIAERSRPPRTLQDWRAISSRLQLLAPELALLTQRHRAHFGTSAGSFVDYISPRSLRASYRRWSAARSLDVCVV